MLGRDFKMIKRFFNDYIKEFISLDGILKMSLAVFFITLVLYFNYSNNSNSESSSAFTGITTSISNTKKNNTIVWQVPVKNKKVIALTFDDGPTPGYTDKILKILRKYNVKATFFVIGSKAQKYPSLVRREANYGHEIANHTYTHPKISKLSFKAYKTEMKKTQNVVKKITGSTPVLMRPPYGDLNESATRYTQKLGFKMILWSWDQDTRDWSHPGVNTIVKKVLNNASSGDIVLFHDNNTTMGQTASALETIIPELKRRGYSFVTVSELLKLKGQ